jgi:acyl dehydratase
VKTFRDLDDLRSAVGARLGTSDWITVDQARVQRFADATDDHQWIHVDTERASSGPFGSTIAHGYLTLSLLTSLVWSVYRVEGLAMQINYGADKVRFLSPVVIPSRLRAAVDLVSVDPSGDGYRVKTNVTIEIEGSDKPACVAEVLAYVIPLPSQPEPTAGAS